MSASLRKHRASVFTYSDTGADGLMVSTYTKVASTDTDGDWWCARMTPTGRESTLVRKAEHTVDALFSFSAYAPVSEDGLLIVDGVQYLIRAILVRDYGRDDVQVLAERSDDEFTIL